MFKAVFIDRDGTINKEVDHLHRLGQLKVLPGAGRAIKQINDLGFLVVVITNQAAVAHGMLTEADLNTIHAALRQRLARNGARIDAIYYCPHHPDAKLKKYRVRCTCRKPGTTMIKKALRELKISAKNSYLIGDHTNDILAGERAGLRTILVQTGYDGKDGKNTATPDFIAKNLLAAVKIIRSQK